tara:strand:+ start:1909 stop:2472 length:564 start_codon:yes stop_codon:yes gene_type:complete
MEQRFVVDFYNNNSKSFNDTRYAPWPCVKEFIDKIKAYSVVSDIGCGNGKNQYRKDLFYVSCDNSSAMCAFTNADLADCTNLPYKNQSFDAVICIAVIHHLATEARRITALKEIKRVMKQTGNALISVWGAQPKFGSGTQIIGWNKKSQQRFIHFFTLKEIDNLCMQVFENYVIKEDFNNFFIYVNS